MPRAWLTDRVAPEIRLGLLIHTRAQQSFVVERHPGKQVEAAFREVVVFEGRIRAQGL